MSKRTVTVRIEHFATAGAFVLRGSKSHVDVVVAEVRADSIRFAGSEVAPPSPDLWG